MQQLQRMDGLYATNTKAYDQDWQGTMASYQSQLTAETAKQMTERGPRAQLVELPDVGHAPTFVNADQIEIARRFLLS
jgi:pimeloyl-ACP methyl ester carboxylesterase